MNKSTVAFRLLIAFFASLFAAELAAQSSDEIEGYLKPYSQTELSTTETGVITDVLVERGSVVQPGDLIATLDNQDLEKSLAVAVQESKLKGNLNVAKAELALQKQRLKQISDLIRKGHGRQSELDRANVDVEIATNRLLRAEEELLVKKAEVDRIRARLNSREIRSRIKGHVVEIHKRKGEAVSPNQPILLTVVNIEKLKVEFDVHRGLAQQFSDGTPVTLTLLSGSNLEATVEWKSPLIDAESETVKIVVVYDNAEGKISSGEYCTLTPANERLTKSEEESDSSHTIFKSIRATRNSD